MTADRPLENSAAQPTRTPDEIRDQIRELVAEYHAANWQERDFVPGQTPVNVSGRVFDAEDVQSLVDSVTESSTSEYA